MSTMEDPGIGEPGQEGRAARGHRRRAQALAKARLLRQVGKQVPQVNACVPQPPRLGGNAGKGLHHGERHQFRIAQLRINAHLRPPRRFLRPVSAVTPWNLVV